MDLTMKKKKALNMKLNIVHLTTVICNCTVMLSSLYWTYRDVTFSHGWSAAGTDEPLPCWLSVIWRFIKVRRSRRARVNCGFFYFMDSLISQGSLASTHIPVLTNAAPHNVLRPPPAVHWMHHMINPKGPITLPKCILGGVRHSITESVTHGTIDKLFTVTIGG